MKNCLFLVVSECALVIIWKSANEDRCLKINKEKHESYKRRETQKTYINTSDPNNKLDATKVIYLIKAKNKQVGQTSGLLKTNVEPQK